MSTRRYDSSGRRAAADRARARVVDSAGRLFRAHGYADTTVAEIASEAGVSAASVYATFGSKSGLLARVIDVAIAGDQAAASLGERPAARAALAAPTGRRACDLTAALIAAVQQRVSDLLPLLREAATVDTDAAALQARQEAGRHSGMREFVQGLGDRRRPTLDVGRAADIAYVLTDPTHFHRLVTQGDWSVEEYTTWLADALFDGLCRRR